MSDRTFETIFGPVTSRRFGRSLGVDVIPRKLCTLDCVYCEVGRTDRRGLIRKDYIPAERILRDLASALPLHPDLDCVTYSGSGEPTLHSRLGYLLRETRSLTSLPVIVLTNGTLLWHEDVRNELVEADTVCPSLNAVSEDIFRRINRPHPALTVERVLDGLTAFRTTFRGKYFLEILFVLGLNDGDEEVESLRKACARIQPDRIHVNTVVRPPAESWAKPVPLARLRDISRMLGPTAEVLIHHEPGCSGGARPVESIDILSLLQRRPMSVREIVESLSSDEDHVQPPLRKLVSSGSVHALVHEGDEYFAVTRDDQLA